jgi:site-specific DNA-methyltransferase (adenine-specific)
VERGGHFENGSESGRMINEIITGNNVEVLRGMPDGFIDLTVTSPPYDNLRDYKGYSFDFEALANELYRVTKPGGVVVWIVGDAMINGSETGTSFKQALYFKEIGFNLHDTMIYEKNGGGARGSNLAYWQCFEYMFVFSKGKPCNFNPIEDRPNVKAGKTYKTGGRRNVDGSLTDTKIITAKQFGKRKNIWRIGTGKNVSTKDEIAFCHPAIFPEQLAEDHIVSWSNPCDIVLDPFGGSGTTAKMAKLSGRSFIHIDISEEYNEIARQRIEGVDVNGSR